MVVLINALMAEQNWIVQVFLQTFLQQVTMYIHVSLDSQNKLLANSN